MKNNRIIKNNYISMSILAIFISVLSCFNIAKAETRPEAILDIATKSMLSTLKNNKLELKQNPNKIYAIVDDILVPHIDTEYMSKWVVGKQHWVAASPDQRTRFMLEFKRMVVRSYASSLLAYSDQTVTYYPIKGAIEGKNKVQVNSVIRQPNGSNVNVAYRLLRTSSGWKVYDLIIEGVSLLQGFQSQFADDLRAAGLEKLIAKLQTHNSKPLNVK